MAQQQTKHLFHPALYPTITAPVKLHTPFTFRSGDWLGAVCLVVSDKEIQFVSVENEDNPEVGCTHVRGHTDPTVRIHNM